MPAYRLAAALLVALTVLAFACNGDDDGAKESPSVSVRTSTPNGDDGTATPDGGNDKTPIDEETPAASEPPDEKTPAPLPTATEGTPAIAPADQRAYVTQFAGRDVQEEPCTYNPSTRVTDCPQRDRYAVDPPLAGQDISCSLGVVDGQPEYVRCSSAEPQQNKYYEIQR
jgi:hypothetical protein